MDLSQYAAMMQARDPHVFDEPPELDWDGDPQVGDNPAHYLNFVSEFTEETVGWKTLDSGGQVPIRAPLDPTHWRWYCRCGAVSGRLPDEETARTAHLRHVKANTEGAYSDG